METSGTKGTAEKISIRSVTLRNSRGSVATVPPTIGALHKQRYCRSRGRHLGHSGKVHDETGQAIRDPPGGTEAGPQRIPRTELGPCQSRHPIKGQWLSRHSRSRDVGQLRKCCGS
nr:hypothetical protein [Mesorhizobium sp.]